MGEFEEEDELGCAAVFLGWMRGDLLSQCDAELVLSGSRVEFVRVFGIAGTQVGHVVHDVGESPPGGELAPGGYHEGGVD